MVYNTCSFVNNMHLMAGGMLCYSALLNNVFVCHEAFYNNATFQLYKP